MQSYYLYQILMIEKSLCLLVRVNIMIIVNGSITTSGHQEIYSRCHHVLLLFISIYYHLRI
jgi:hypothetical protein